MRRSQRFLHRRCTSSCPTKVALGTALIVVVFLGYAGVAPAFAGTPWWHMIGGVRPSVLKPGGEGTLVVQAVNVGDAPTSGPTTLSETVPAGFSIQNAKFFAFSAREGREDFGPSGGFGRFEMCSIEASATRVTCTTEVPSLHFELIGPVTPFEDLELQVQVRNEGPVSGVSTAKVSGGSAPAAALSKPVPIGDEAPAFGVEDYELVPEEAGGGVDAQAGSHPFQLTTTLALNQNADVVRPPALPKDLKFQLPPGLIGNTLAIPQCSDADFRFVLGGTTADRCPTNTVVGVATITVDEPVTLGLRTLPVPLFNLTPGPGEPARFGFEFTGTPVTLDTSVRTGGDYGVTVAVSNITELTNFLSSTVTFWGVPGDASHDESRGWGCVAAGHWAGEVNLGCTPARESHPEPFLTMPTSCTAPFSTRVEGVSWPLRRGGSASNPESIPLPTREYSLQDEFARPLGVTGCNQLPFNPSIEVQPDVQSGSTPTGLAVHVRVPQEVSENATGLASASVKDTTVVLPAGMGLDPSGANGLEACTEAQVGFSGVGEDGTDLFTRELGTPFCPTASKVGTVKFKIPIIANPLEGAVYLAAQGANPFGSLVAMYIVAEDPVSGVRVKLAGEVALTESGQVITTLKNSPQAPLEEAEFHFFGGDRAPLATPALCDRYETTASFTPWSETPPVKAASSFKILTGPSNGPCQNPLPFAPSLAAGTTNIQAAAFTPLTTTISRDDGNQDISAVQLHLPPGLTGLIASVKLCPEAQANAGTCPVESRIGHTTVSVGLGVDPYSVAGGEVFVTGPYKGAPFGLSIVNPAKAGPFDLGKVVVRAKLEIDPHTAAVTITTDSGGPYAIPHILQGIPLQIKHVNVVIDRPQFTLNPTNCRPLEISGAIESSQGVTAPVSTPFQVTNCATLKFAPTFSVSTSGKTSKLNGAGLSVKLTYPKGSLGHQANIAQVKVALPKQLPSRLTTLQKACLAATFAANPANCPAGSVVGHARVTTPLLPVPLTGPAYFISHGGEAFPSLEIVLQGDNVTVDLVGATLIRNGITTTTFKTVPDTPFNEFELTLPQGKFSALAANGSLCKASLIMPTVFKAQNGLEKKQNTPIKVTGCAKRTAKKHKRTSGVRSGSGRRGHKRHK